MGTKIRSKWKDVDMTRGLLFLMILVSEISACKKEGLTPNYPAYYGQWEYIGSSWGPGFNPPAADSMVVLTLSSPNNYTTSLNGMIVRQGSFQVDSSSKFVILTFNNITQPYGSQTVVRTNTGLTYLYFNSAKTGQLTLYQHNYTASPADTLILSQGPVITPEALSNFFKRM